MATDHIPVASNHHHNNPDYEKPTTIQLAMRTRLCIMAALLFGDGVSYDKAAEDALELEHAVHNILVKTRNNRS